MKIISRAIQEQEIKFKKYSYFLKNKACLSYQNKKNRLENSRWIIKGHRTGHLITASN